MESSSNVNSPAAPNQSDSQVRNFFSTGEWCLYGAILLIGLILRWTLLDMRPYHHDESLHGMYGRYFYDWPNSNFYKYDPMLHGPMLYNSMRFIYASFGDSLWAARIPVCTMGSIFMLMPLLFRGHLGRALVLILTAFIALSPTLVYWSRFLREDYWVVSGMLMVVYGFIKAPIPQKSFWVMMGISIQWCTKENIFVSLAVFVGYLLFEVAFRGIRSEKLENSIAGKIVDYISRYPWETCWAFIFSFLVYCWFYSAGFRYPEGITDGLGSKGFEYWMKHHGMERIEGPFNFHTYVLGWYELPFLLAFITHLVLFYRRTSLEIQMFAGAIVVALLFALFASDPSTIKANWSFFKLKDRYDLVGLFILLGHAPLVTIHHLLRRQYGLGACAYFFSANYFVYSYLGEKVPWLSIYPLIFGLPYLGLFFKDYFSAHPFNFREFPIDRLCMWIGCGLIVLSLFFMWEQRSEITANVSIIKSSAFIDNVDFLALGSLLAIFGVLNQFGGYVSTIHLGRLSAILVFGFMLRACIQTNFLYAGKESEYLSQVHTTYEIGELAQRVIDEVRFEKGMYKPKILVTGDATWPLTWYFRHLPNEYKFSALPDEKKNFTYIIQDYKDNPTANDVLEGYSTRKLNLRGWWVPDFREMTLKKFLRYSINHYPWSGTGFSHVTLLAANDTSRFLAGSK